MLSVIICTHNPRGDYFQRCIGALRGQKLPYNQWELVLVDNRSDEPVADRVDLSWHSRGHIVREETLGLTAARLRGIRESRGDLLVFVDDDNVLDVDFLEVALRTMEERPFLGSWSGQCRPAFEAPPPEWTRRYWGNLVIREFDHDIWSNLPRLPQSMPCGAGLCVRRNVAVHYLDLHESGKRSFQFDRSGKSLLSGGDNDLAACACGLGLGVGLIASLKLTHLISPERLTVDYIARLAEGIQYSSTLLDSEYGIRTQQRTALGRTADFLRIVRLKQPHSRILRAAFRGRDRALQQLTQTDIGRTPGKELITNLRHDFVLALKRVLYGRRGEPYRIDGSTLRYLPGTRPVRLRYARSQNGVARYDALQVAWLSTHLTEGDTAVDIGAHYGVYSILMAAKCGQTGHVVAFEPDPYACEVLVKNLSLNPGIKRPVIEACACSDSTGEATLFSRRGNAQSSLARSAVEFSPAHKSEEFRVPLVTLDSYLLEHNLPEPRWVKIDAEGAEIRILKGAQKILAGNAGILCELHPYAWPEFGNTLAELKALAAAAGRRIRYLDQDAEIGEEAQYGTVFVERQS